MSEGETQHEHHVAAPASDAPTAETPVTETASPTETVAGAASVTPDATATEATHSVGGDERGDSTQPTATPTVAAESPAAPSAEPTHADDEHAAAAGPSASSEPPTQQQEDKHAGATNENHRQEASRYDAEAHEYDDAGDENFVAKLGDHGFTAADVNDITRIQSVFRRQQSMKEINVRKQEKLQREAQKASSVVARITMPPDDDEDIKANTAATNGGAAAAVAGAAPGSGAAPGRNARMLKVDPKILRVNEMSADTHGMQRVYTRMLQSKSWW